jgi:Mn2+/Fe2+ NRAMP family transporter
MLLLVNKSELMGEDRNGPWGNAIAISTSVIMIGLTLVLIWNSIRV